MDRDDADQGQAALLPMCKQVVWTTLDDERLGALSDGVLWLERDQSLGEARCTAALLTEAAARERAGLDHRERVVLGVVAARLLPDAGAVARVVDELGAVGAAQALVVDAEVLAERLRQLALSASAAPGARA